MIIDGEASYGYDALGRVTSRTQGATQQRFVYSGLDNDIVTVTDAAAPPRPSTAATCPAGCSACKKAPAPRSA
ncbi:hypothetical protein ACFQX6_13660 [Streptosporangium lutulentum]